MISAVDIQADGAAVAWHVAEWVTGRALATPDCFAWSLPGGSTPKTMYSLLAIEPVPQPLPRSSQAAGTL